MVAFNTVLITLFPFLALSVLAGPPQVSGSSDRIVGGYEVSPAFKYSFMVSLWRKSFHFCGGSLITRNRVITAAHCTYGNTTETKALVHRHDLFKNDAAEMGTTYSISSWLVYPNYDTFFKDGDAAIWKLNSADNTPTGLLLDDGTFGNAQDTMYTVIGWGSTDYLKRASSFPLREVQVPNFNATQCKINYDEAGYKVKTDLVLCAGYADGGKDACFGDSGGPLFKVSTDGKYTLVGIVSSGNGCALKGFPGLYTRTSVVKDWILKSLY